MNALRIHGTVSIKMHRLASTEATVYVVTVSPLMGAFYEVL